jgi:microcystin-dependent protein
MQQDERKAHDIGNHLVLIVVAWLFYALALGLPAVSHGQSLQCWSWNATTKTWVYNQACAAGGGSPWQIALGKTFTVDNTLTLSGTDNATLNIGNGGALGTAAYASAQSFQPSGGSLNLVGTDTTTSVTNGTSTSCSSGQKTWTAVSPAALGFTTGMMVTAYETSNPAVYMQGPVCSYSGPTLTISSSYSQGTYTGTGWTIQISGPQGPQGSAGASSAPVGSLNLWASSSLPINYLWASGPSFTACVSNATYSGLYAAVGDTWTTVNGCNQGTTFGIPDMRARFPLGAGQGATAENGGTGTNRTLGQESNGGPNAGSGTIYGAETHTQTISEMPSHNHGGQTAGVASGYEPGVQVGGEGPGYPDSGGTLINFYTNVEFYIASQGGGNTQSIMNPFAVVNYIIRYQ